MEKGYDVVIVGGGVVGSSIAYFLTRNGDFKGSVCVVERDPTYEGASSSLSASGMRQQFGTPPNIGMSALSVEFIRDARRHLSVPDHDADAGFHDDGYLILAGADRREAFLAKNAVQVANGVDVEVLGPDALIERFPAINAEGVALASLGRRNEGWFDGPGLHQAFRRKARLQGAHFIKGTVTGLARSPSAISSVEVDGRSIGCGMVINAAGAWSGEVARLAGMDLPVVPRKRCVFVLESPARVSFFLHDTSGIWLRPEGRLYICGTTPELENAPDDFGLEVDYPLFEESIWPALAHRVPAFEELRMLRAWAGHYDYNLFDHSAILGHVPDISNFIMANGFSGHGMMHSPATGLGISELVIYGHFRTLDLTPFTYERIAAKRDIPEYVF